MPLNNKPWLYDKMHNVQIYSNKNELVENKLVNISIRHSSFLQIKVRDPKSFVFNYTCDINNAKFNVMRKEQSLEIDFEELGSHLLEMLNLHLEKDMLIKCVLGEHNLNLVFYEKSKIKSLVFLNIELFVTDQKEMFEEMQASIKTQEEALNKCKYENSVLKKEALHFEKQFEMERNLKNDLNASFKKHIQNIETTYLEKCTQHQNLLLFKIDLFNNKIQTLQQNLTIIKQENHLKCESSARLLQGMESLRLESLENATIINGLKRENLNMENRIKNQDADIQNYKRLLTQFEEKKQDLCKTIEEQRKDLENSAFIIAQKNSLCEELKKDMEQAKNVIIKYSKHCDAKAQDFENLEKDIKIKENYIAEQEHELKKLTQEFEEYKFNYSQENIDEPKEELLKALSTIQNLEKDKRELAKRKTNTTCYRCLISKRNAGHSKWANIRHIKGAKDAERAKLFTKLSRQIQVAVTEGGGFEPKFNVKLEQVIEQARRANMPAATVQSTLKSMQLNKTQGKAYTLEIKGPGSCSVLCEVFTSNLIGVKGTMAGILRKHSSKFSDGGMKHLFDEKGIIEIDLEKYENCDEIVEKSTDHAIEAGAEDVKLLENNILQFICDKNNLKSVTSALENLKYPILSASVEFIPLKMQQLSELDLQTYSNLYEKLENLPDVVRISDNIA